ncbi:hypothetical protein LBMAG21_02940 [Armatimonadota bacterium]|nr:hypothetical protein LBMAG21_02940 [Armatimonadota bacterium]
MYVHSRFAFFIGSLYLLSAYTLPASAQSPDIAPKLAKIEETLNKKYKELHIPGVAIAIVKDDKIIFSKGFGLRNVEAKLPVTPSTLFAIGSSTKAFTATSLMMSVEEKRVGLEDAPRQYLPFFRLRDSEADTHITIRDLLCHRSGLPRTDITWYTGVLRPEDVIRAAGSAVPTAKLGEKFQYQNVMFLTAGEVVAKVQKTSWQNFVRKRIFAPLGMKQSNFTPREMARFPDYSLGYIYSEAKKEVEHLPMRDLTNAAPAGAINSNVNEMAQWVRLWLNRGVYNGKRLLSDASVAEMTKPQMKMSAKASYGFGWMLYDWNGHKIVEHGGNIDGFNAQVALMPDQKLGFVLLTNVSASPLGASMMESVWENLVGGAKKGEEVKPQPIQASTVKPEEEAGIYHLAEANVDFSITFESGKLVVKVPGQPAYTLESLGGRRYKLGSPAPAGFFITFRPKKDNPSTTEALLEQPQGNITLVKKEVKPLFHSPLSTEELLGKMVSAVGGEVNLRKIKTVTLVSVLEMESQGYANHLTQYYKSPNLTSEYNELRSVGKKIGWIREYFDGVNGGQVSSFAPSQVKSEGELADAGRGHIVYALLEAKRLYKSIAITGVEKVGDEEAYVLEKTPEKGVPTKEYVSTRSFLVLKSVVRGAIATYHDYRKVGNFVTPFRTFITTPNEGNIIITVQKVKLDDELSDTLFEAPTKE